jgi:glycosyltransferase involved in cell wall biosynthesis
MASLTVAFCTYKRAGRLEKLIAELRAQICPVPFEILAVNNNSPDNTLEVLEYQSSQPGASLRFVTEIEQGIVPARNRAIEESLGSDIMVFIDDDELPQPGLLAAAYDAIVNEGAQCAGGRVEVDFSPHGRPRWLGNELLGFLAEVDHRIAPFWIVNDTTPIWTANVAYDMQLFRNDPALRFDKRYNREGADVGGGEDVAMFRTLLAQGTKIRYRPDMAVLHFVEPWRLKRSYFLKLHYRAGLRTGRYELPNYAHTLFGIPPYLVALCIRQSINTLGMFFAGKPGSLRQGMNAAHAFGSLVGYRARKNP